MKPHYRIPIVECNEPLVPIPPDLFALETPHPYVKLGAPYGGKSPYFLRQGVLNQLILAQSYLQHQYPGWQIYIFDAYRPLPVQQFMVNHAFAEAVRTRELSLDSLTDRQRETIWEQVYQFWAIPSANPATPPPHSTGAAVDISLVDANGLVIDMGSPIDELSPRSYPDYFAPCSDRSNSGTPGVLSLQTEPATLLFHYHRQLLQDIMVRAGFRQHPNEWWHFSLGDQMWAWLENLEQLDTTLVARYGAIESF